jgi:hypothetical protein
MKAGLGSVARDGASREPLDATSSRGWRSFGEGDVDAGAPGEVALRGALPSRAPGANGADAPAAATDPPSTGLGACSMNGWMPGVGVAGADGRPGQGGGGGGNGKLSTGSGGGGAGGGRGGAGGQPGSGGGASIALLSYQSHLALDHCVLTAKAAGNGGAGGSGEAGQAGGGGGSGFPPGNLAASGCAGGAGGAGAGGNGAQGGPGGVSLGIEYLEKAVAHAQRLMKLLTTMETRRADAWFLGRSTELRGVVSLALGDWRSGERDREDAKRSKETRQGSHRRQGMQVATVVRACSGFAAGTGAGAGSPQQRRPGGDRSSIGVLSGLARGASPRRRARHDALGRRPAVCAGWGHVRR